MFKLTAIGRLCKDPTGYDKCTKLRIATIDKEAIFFNGVIFDKKLDKTLQYLKKGSLIYMEGFPKINSYNDNHDIEMIVNHIKVIQFKANEQPKEEVEDDEELKGLKILYPLEKGFKIIKDDRGYQIYDKKGENITEQTKIPF